MHPSSYREMQKFAAGMDPSAEYRIAEFGSFYVNGSYRDLFRQPGWVYIGYDLQPGRGVDCVLADPYDWPEIESESYDIVISGQTLEHVPKPWVWIKSLERVLRVGGQLCLIVMHTWEFHEFPGDYWRVWPAGMQVLLDETQLQRIVIYKNENDTVLIARKVPQDVEG